MAYQSSFKSHATHHSIDCTTELSPLTKEDTFANRNLNCPPLAPPPSGTVNDEDDDEQQKRRNSFRFKSRCKNQIMLWFQNQKPKSLLLIATYAIVVLLMFGKASSASSDGGRCASSGNRFECPADICDDGTTVYVSDCLDCAGYFNTDSKNKQCFDRKIFNGQDNPSPAYLWYDVIGAIVWFCAAGVATACGVGGGGIYVPLGILLLQFAPKPSSGLSQSSIFGASLGGLILNIRNRHPYTTKVTKTHNATHHQEDTNTTHSTDNEITDDDDDDADTPLLSLESIPNKHNDEYHDTEDTHYYTRPLIDYDMALFLAPMEMAGAVLGVLIQKILPNWLYLTLAAIILGLTAKKTYTKYFDVRAKERAASESGEANPRYSSVLLPIQGGTQQPGRGESGNTVGQEAPLSSTTATPNAAGASDNEVIPSKNDHEASAAITTVTSDPGSGSGEDHTYPPVLEGSGEEGDEQPSSMIDEEKVARRQFLMEQDARQYPYEKLFALFILWVGLVVLTFLKGGKGVESIVGITCESPWYGVLIGIQFAWTLGFAIFFAQKLIAKHNEKVAVGYQFHPQDVHWDHSKTRFYAVFTFFAGIVAGLIGIGGGMVLGPLMLVAGIHPRVSSATTATMIVLTSSSVAVLFVTAGLVPWEYAVTFFSICFCGAYIGKTYIDGYVKRTGKASLLIFLLATIIALATIGCIVIVLTRLADANWCFAGFNQFCSVDAEDALEDQCEANRRALQQDLPFLNY